MLKYLKSSVSAVLLGTFVLGNAYAAEVKSIAILTPEEGTDYGWNQQGVDAAKAAGDSGRRRGRRRPGPWLWRRSPDAARTRGRRGEPD